MTDGSDNRLRLLIERIERLEEEKRGIADDIKDVYGEAKAVGYDARIMRQIVRLRKMQPDDRAEQEMLLDTYKAALGLGFESTPLRAAVRNFEETTKGVAVSMQVGDGEFLPINAKARADAAKPH